MDISDVFLIMKLSNWCLMATYKHINIILGTVLCTLCQIVSLAPESSLPRSKTLADRLETEPDDRPDSCHSDDWLPEHDQLHHKEEDY
jgi:hypothetical protein